MKVLVPVTQAGYRLGEAHHRTRYSDETVDLVRELADLGISERAIAERLGMPRRTVRSIKACTVRAASADRYVPVPRDRLPDLRPCASLAVEEIEAMRLLRPTRCRPSRGSSADHRPPSPVDEDPLACVFRGWVSL